MINRFWPLAMKILLVALFTCGAVGASASGAAAKENGQLFQACVLTVDKGKDQIKVTLNPKGATMIKKGDRIILTNAISDFSVPFNQIKSKLTRAQVGGKVLVNLVEIYPIKNNKNYAVVVRFTTKGAGKGPGKTGCSLLTAFCLDKPILKSPGQAELVVPCKGKLAPSGGSLKSATPYIKADLAKAGAKSKSYTMLAALNDKINLFLGFAVWDPTNPKSLNSAYFEFKNTESKSTTWSISSLKK